MVGFLNGTSVSLSFISKPKCILSVEIQFITNAPFCCFFKSNFCFFCCLHFGGYIFSVWLKSTYQKTRIFRYCSCLKYQLFFLLSLYLFHLFSILIETDVGVWPTATSTESFSFWRGVFQPAKTQTAATEGKVIDFTLLHVNVTHYRLHFVHTIITLNH